ncbi:hypothetical protein PILCRDRAFT_502092 [Piloderma croceum F 1598]|uniref:Uncharacterized protein n=1 Tax=Piloderma croceum (strain F 1598) TaxID=765440 RepID=A0A0C3FQM6_PILCF|nr:hypothetical protein PILCRDRAFT_502092 [Piloderma croceum F 1598]
MKRRRTGNGPDQCRTCRTACSPTALKEMKRFTKADQTLATNALKRDSYRRVSVS